MQDGVISKCPCNGCNYTCCDFNQNNFIVMYPHEYEEAKQNGFNLGHLEITDENYFGGKKAICHARERQTCDNGYKPLDCKSYPLFPVTGEEELEIGFIKGKKCPLLVEDLGEHARYVKQKWQALMQLQPLVGFWLSNVNLVGYEKIKLKAETPSAEFSSM